MITPDMYCYPQTHINNNINSSSIGEQEGDHIIVSFICCLMQQCNIALEEKMNHNTCFISAEICSLLLTWIVIKPAETKDRCLFSYSSNSMLLFAQQSTQVQLLSHNTSSDSFDLTPGCKTHLATKQMFFKAVFDLWLCVPFKLTVYNQKCVTALLNSVKLFFGKFYKNVLILPAQL